MLFNVSLNGVIIKQTKAVRISDIEIEMQIDETKPFEFYRLSEQYGLFDIQLELNDNAQMYVARNSVLQIEEYGRSIEELLTNLHDRLAGRLKTALVKVETKSVDPDMDMNIFGVSNFDQAYLRAFIKSPMTSVIFYPVLDEGSGSSPIQSAPFSDASMPFLDAELTMLRSNINLLKKIIDHMVQ
jgi:hypothetical protein